LGGGKLKLKLNSAQLELELGLSLAINEYHVKQIVNSMETRLSDDTINNKE
jgi:hypothetical protein